MEVGSVSNLGCFPLTTAYFHKAGHWVEAEKWLYK